MITVQIVINSLNYLNIQQSEEYKTVLSCSHITKEMQEQYSKNWYQNSKSLSLHKHDQMLVVTSGTQVWQGK